MCFLSEINAQQRFGAGLIIGLNAAQINGDEHAGFNKAGIEGGLRATARLTEKTDLGIEIVYSQRGSRSKQNDSNTNEPFKVTTNYAAIPITYNYKDWYMEDDYYRIHFHAGLNYGRLIGSKIVGDGVIDSELESYFNQNDLSWLVGATYYINEHFGLTARYSRFITLLYNREKAGPDAPNKDALRSMFLTFNAVYMF